MTNLTLRMTLQTIPDCGDEPFITRVGNVAGFSLHAGVATQANEREKLERLCRYITRPARNSTSMPLALYLCPKILNHYTEPFSDTYMGISRLGVVHTVNAP